MKKLMLFNGKAMACLMLLCLLLAQGCKKEVHQHPTTQTDNLNPGQLIKAAKLDAWFATNPVARFLSPNWAKARQAKVNDKRIVRVPLFNIDKATAIANATTAIEGKNANYNEEHPPEIFFIEDQSGKLYSFLLNFIPTDPTKENGENGIWTGKLYEWNMTGDTIHVQDIVKSRLKERFAFKAGQDSGNELLSAKLKNNKLQSLGGLKDKQVSSFFGLLKNLVENLVGFVGNLFGLSEYRGRYNEGGYWEGYRLTMMWKYLTNYDDPNTLGGNPAFAEVIYAAGGPKVYESYLYGYINNNDPEEDTNHDWNGNVRGGGSGGSGGGPSYTPYDYWPSSPPTEPVEDLIAKEERLNAEREKSIELALINYLDEYGKSDENIQFALWAKAFLSEGHKNGYADYMFFLRTFDQGQNVDPIVFRIYYSMQCALIRLEHADDKEVYPEWRISLDALIEMGQLVLDGVGLVPGIGEVADLTNATIYALKGDGVNATLSAASAIPFVGWFSTGAKFAKKAIITAKGNKTTLKWIVREDGLVNFGNSRQLRSSLGLVSKDGLQAHHIIPWGKQAHEVVQKAAKKDGASPFHLNDALNGVPLDETRHLGSHADYDAKIAKKMNDFMEENPSATPDQCYDEVVKIIQQVKTALKNNPNTHINQLVF